MTAQDALRAAESVREHDKTRLKRLLDEAAREDEAIRRGEVIPDAPRR